MTDRSEEFSVKTEKIDAKNFGNNSALEWSKREQLSSTDNGENMDANVLIVQKTSINYEKHESNRPIRNHFENENMKNWFEDEHYQIFQLNSQHSNDLDKLPYPYDVQMSSANGIVENGLHQGIYQRTDMEYPVAYSMENFGNERMNSYFADTNQPNMWNNGYFSEEVYRSNKIKPVTVEDPMAPLSPIVRQRGRPRGSSGTLLDEEGKAICLSGDKNEQRRQRNRLAAIQSRTRRKLYIQKLEERQHEQSFIISRLQNEIHYLRLMAGIPLDLPIQNIMDFTNIVQPNPPTNSTVTKENDHINRNENCLNGNISKEEAKD